MRQCECQLVITVTQAVGQGGSHTGGFVSPTDRPTISAMTASRINRAKAMIMYICQVNGRQSLITHLTLKIGLSCGSNKVNTETDPVISCNMSQTLDMKGDG